jgi:hypothetical protein
MTRRICPRHQVIVLDAPREELDLELVPLDSHGFESIALYGSGFKPRTAPVTEAELKSMDLVRHVAASHRGVKS